MLVELVATGLAAEAMEQKLKAKVTEHQAEECLPYLRPQSMEVKAWSRTPTPSPGSTPAIQPALTKLCMVSGTSSRTSTMSSSPSRGAMAVSQAVTVFRLQEAWKGVSGRVDRDHGEAGNPHKSLQAYYPWSHIWHV